MSLKVILQQVIVVLFLVITAAALLFTLFRIQIPFIPSSLIYYSYGMMAPYQGDTSWNEDVHAEGELQNGTWVTINLDPYFPFLLGEANARRYLRDFAPKGQDYQRQKYTDFAMQLLEHEREHGNEYLSVRLYFERWDRSPGGFNASRSILLQKQFLTQVQ